MGLFVMFGRVDYFSFLDSLRTEDLHRRTIHFTHRLFEHGLLLSVCFSDLIVILIYFVSLPAYICLGFLSSLYIATY